MKSADERSCRADLQWRMKLEAQLEGFVAMKNPGDAWVEGMTLLPDTELADIWAEYDSELERLGVPSIEREHFKGRARFKQSTRIVGWMSGFALGFLSPGGSEVSVAGELAQIERAPVIADAMLADSRAALSATIREAETTAARRFVWRRADSAQLYRELGLGDPVQSVADEPVRLAAGRTASDSYVSFAHGTSNEYAKNISSAGLSESASRAAMTGSHQPGSFFTHQLGPPEAPGMGLQQAADWAGPRHAEPAIVVMSLPQSLYEELLAAKLVRTGPIPGGTAEMVHETIFSPGAFPKINSQATWQVIPLRRR